MPIYEYICNSCNKKVSIFHRTFSDLAELICPSCGSKDLKRIISGFAVHKSISTIYEENPIQGISGNDDYFKDPRNIGRNLEKKFKDMNVEMPSEIQHEIAAAREGILPDMIKGLDTVATPDSAYS